MLLDREVTASYRLVAQATDGGGRWCRAEVQLDVTDVNDNPPIFTLSQYSASVYEDTATKALLTRIQAIDPDQGDSIRGRFITFKTRTGPHSSVACCACRHRDSTETHRTEGLYMKGLRAVSMLIVKFDHCQASLDFISQSSAA